VVDGQTPAAGGAENILVSMAGVGVRFGTLEALGDVDMLVCAGECLGLVGHNGAGKSTLINVINGSLSPHQGQLRYRGHDEEKSVRTARKHGIRCVFQELALLANLTVAENVRIITQSGFEGAGWRQRALTQIKAKLDEIFPGNNIDCRATVAELGLAQQQMVEIAINFLDAGEPAQLVILDEPTSSLDASIAQQLLDFVRVFVAQGGTVILISHMLGEILSASTRIIVMKNGRIVANRTSRECDRAYLVATMGDKEAVQVAQQHQHHPAHAPVVLSVPPQAGQGRSALVFKAHQGEIVGFAGLAGHGQSNMLLALYATHRKTWWSQRNCLVAFIAGDRRLNGIFPLWSIAKNLSITALHTLAKFGLLNQKKEAVLTQSWQKTMMIKTPDINHDIVSLSGGNQQKVLFARALATSAPVVLMDDPMRGVDVGTKNQVYAMVRQEADNGRTFIWYSTEMEELALCDRVYVFRNHAMVAEFERHAITEKNIIAASFAGED